MEKLEVTRNAQTDQFSVVLSRGNDSISCMITVETGRVLSDEEKHRAAPVPTTRARVLRIAGTIRPARLAGLRCRLHGEGGHRLRPAPWC